MPSSTKVKINDEPQINPKGPIITEMNEDTITKECYLGQFTTHQHEVAFPFAKGCSASS